MVKELSGQKEQDREEKKNSFLKLHTFKSGYLENYTRYQKT